jgi:outer membrane protein OmpA-like peptidoglycan-associated protein
MAKKTLYLLGILLTIIIGSILYYNYCSNCRVTTAATTAALPDSATNSAKADTAKTDTSKVDTVTKPAAADTVAHTTDWRSLKQKLNADPLVLYFETGRTQLPLTAEEKQKVTGIVNYLQNVESSSLAITGYSDNVGTREMNIKLSALRAEFAKDYFVKNGVNADKISTSGKGPDDPVGDNATAEGRSKNRRTVITIN